MPEPRLDADADADEEALLLDTLHGEQPTEELLPSPAPPPRPRRVNWKRRWKGRISVLALLLVLLAFLLWTSFYTRTPAGTPDTDSTPIDSFVLDPDFDHTAPPRTRVYRWTVSSISVPGDTNTNRTRIAVNGRSPGPLIQANAHDRILVYVTNALEKDGTSIHWHGLPQPQTPFYDGTPGVTQCPIPPGATLLYNFTLGGWAGTTWWHGHHSLQPTDGLWGPLVVHSPPDEASAYNYASEHVLGLSDVYAEPASELLHTYLTSNPIETVPEPVPDSVAINGLGGGKERADYLEDDGGQYFEVRVRPGTTTRLRLINAGTFAPLRVSVDAHVLTIIEADGTRVAPVRVRDVVLQPAQRYSVLVSASDNRNNQDDAAFWIRAQMVEDAFAYDNPNMVPEARAVLRYTVAERSTTLPLPTTLPGPAPDTPDWYALPGFDEWTLRPAESDTPMPQNTTPPSHTLPFVFSIQRTHDQNWRSFINSTAWEVPPPGQAALVADVAGLSGGSSEEGVRVWPGDQLIATFRYGKAVDVVITNLDDGDHPFHLHGYAPWLLGTGHGRYKPAAAHLDTTNPMRRDTFTVQRRGWAVVRIVTDNPGYWAFHCHIAWHMAGGGLFQIAVLRVDDAALVLPEDIVEQCKIWMG